MPPRELAQTIEFFHAHDDFAIVGHKDPDGDCLSSQLVLRSLLRGIGKSAAVYSPGPFSRPEIAHLGGAFTDRIPAGSAKAAVVVDCSTIDRIGEISEDLSSLPVAVIDHHSSGVAFGDPRLIDVAAPSVTILVLRLMTAMGRSPDAREAELLLFGLCTDTGFFRHSDHGSENTFSAVAEFVACGASPKRAFRLMYAGRSLASRRFLGQLLERAESHFGGRLLLTFENLDDQIEFGSNHRDSDTMYQQLQNVSGCEVVAFVRQETQDRCSVGLRSISDLDVGAIAERLGGGGHRNASGYDRLGDPDAVKREVLSMLAGAMDATGLGPLSTRSPASP